MNDEDPKLWRPPALDTIEYAKKIAAFDKLYRMTLDHYEEVAENGCCGDDDSHYIYEAVMKLCLGKDIFKHYNKVMR